MGEDEGSVDERLYGGAGRREWDGKDTRIASFQDLKVQKGRFFTNTHTSIQN